MSVASEAFSVARARIPQIGRPWLSLAIVMAVEICAAVQPERPVVSGVRLALSICFCADIVVAASGPASPASAPASAGTVTVTVAVLPPWNAIVASSWSGAVADVFTVWHVEQRSAAKYLPFDGAAAPASAP